MRTRFRRFTYTLVQEKATQLFYQRFNAVATEPVLRDLLLRLARDEARHFAFYAELIAPTSSGTARGDGAGPQGCLGTFRSRWRTAQRVLAMVTEDRRRHLLRHTEAYDAWSGS